MLTYVATSYCCGKRPAHLASLCSYSRPLLVARMLKERNVARFVVAPAGFGKTSLVHEYVDTVFAFDHVFWFDATSPCFLRDVDAGTLVESMRAQESEPFLAVFEDVPALDKTRSELFCAVLDGLLELECEVIVTCAPTGDAYRDQLDRVLISASDLLLSDEELDYVRTPSEREQLPAFRIPPAQRIPGIVWKGDNDGPFLARALHEDFPLDMCAALLVLLCLGKGLLAEACDIVRIDADVIELLADSYPFVGVNVSQGRFETSQFTVAEVAEAFRGKLDEIASYAHGRDAGEFARRLADALLDSGNSERACDVTLLLAPAHERSEWLAVRAARLEQAGCLLRARGVYESLPPDELDASAHVAQAVRCALLGENVSACVAARRAIACGPSFDQRALVQLVQHACSVGEAAEQAQARVRDICEVGQQSSHAEYLRHIAAAVDALDGEQDVDSALAAWLEASASGQLDDVLLYAAVRLFARIDEADAVDDAWEDMASAVAREASRTFTQTGMLPLALALAAASFQRCVEAGTLVVPPLDASCVLAASQAERGLLEQRMQCEGARVRKLRSRRAYQQTHPNSYRRDCAEQQQPTMEAPRLTVNLFGGFEVRVGDKPADPALLRRQKVRMLLALLVANRGRDMSRDRVIELLWPESSFDGARSSFYATWSRLRAALVAPDGTCPYLIRTQRTVRINVDMLASDVLELEDVCRAMLFNRPGRGGWGHLFARVEDTFSGDLLPGDDGCEVLDVLRRDYRTRLVDALITASNRLVEAGDIREGLWFARAALVRDQAREDAYVAVMRAQIASLQRSAALETYFSCRRYLANNLGIDPSAETMRLYRSIIEAQEVVA